MSTNAEIISKYLGESARSGIVELDYLREIYEVEKQESITYQINNFLVEYRNELFNGDKVEITELEFFNSFDIKDYLKYLEKSEYIIDTLNDEDGKERIYVSLPKFTH